MPVLAGLPPFAEADTLPGFDAQVAEAALQAASDSIRGYCGWHIAPEVTEVLTLDGPGVCVLSLPTLYATAVDGLTVDGVAELGYQWSEKGQLRRGSGTWPSRYRAITLTLTHGFEETPGSLAAITTAVAARLASNPNGYRSEAILNYSVTYDSTAAVPGAGGSVIPVGPNLAWILAPYKLTNRP